MKRSYHICILVLLHLASPLCLAQPKYVYPLEIGQKAHAERINGIRYIMSLSENEMLKLVPEQSGIYHTDCPNCETGAQDHANWQWQPQTPHQIKCKGCGAVYPGNPKYPDNKYIAVKSPDGEHKYYYYQKPDGYRIFFRAHADYLRFEYMSKACQYLAELYVITKNEEYSRRAALILTCFAEVYPGYAYKYDYPYAQKRFSPYTVDRIKGVAEYRTTRLNPWGYYGISHELLRAYDVLRFWPKLDSLGRGKARFKIENNLLAGMVEFVMGFEDNYSNLSPRMWTDFIYAGRILDKSDWIEEALTRLNTFRHGSFLYDGYWRETSPSYCDQVFGMLQNTIQSLDGFHLSKGTSTSIADFIIENIEANKRFLTRLKLANDKIKLPNRAYPTINDTWPNKGWTLRESTKSLLAPGLGLAVLGAGEGEHQIYAWLNYTSGYNHKHRDALSIGLFAFNNELLRDIGYTHTKWRSWAISMMSHNTVVVDGLDSELDRQHMKHRLCMFESDQKDFHIAEAESDSAYPSTEVFKRTLLLVGSDSRNAYLVDIFRVKGGDQHDYLLHGSASEDSTSHLMDVAMVPFEGSLMNQGVKFVAPANEYSKMDRATAFGFVKDMSVSPPIDKILLEQRLSSNPNIGISTHLVCPAGSKCYLGKAPRIRQAEKKDHLLPEFYAPFFSARKKGKDLDSVFIAVHELVNRYSKVVSVTSKQIEGGVMVTIDRGRYGKDFFFLGFDGPIVAREDSPQGQIRFNGVYALARFISGKLTQVHLVGSQSFEFNDIRISGVNGWSGDVRKAVRTISQNSYGFFEVDQNIEPPNAGGVLIIEFSDKTVRAYNLVKIEHLDKGTRLYVAEDPGYIVNKNKVEFVTFPQRTISNANISYWLPGVVHKYFN